MPSKDFQTSLFKSQLQKTCALSPQLHYFRTGKLVPECKPEEYIRESDESLLPDASYILTLPPQVHRALTVKHFLEQLEFQNVQIWRGVNGSAHFSGEDYTVETIIDPETQEVKRIKTWFDGERKVFTHNADDGYLSMGERGYRESMKGVINDAIEKGYASIFVMDYDVVFHCQFKEKMLALMRCPRCGNHVRPMAKQGGVLLLGATSWHDNAATMNPRDNFGGWTSVVEDLKIEQTTSASKEKPLCFNMVPCVHGSFAVIYHRNSFQHLLSFLRRPVKEAFDHVYMYLLSRDIIVRSAFPFLAAADIGHASSVDTGRSTNVKQRLKIHHWNATELCKTGSSTELFFEDAGAG